MRIIKVLLGLFFLTSLPLIAQVWWDAGTQIQAQLNGNTVGFIHSKKIPGLPWYVLHSFYIYPEYRGHGYGTALLKKICQRLKKEGARRIYIQPGPYEMEREIALDSQEYGYRMENLIHLYKRVGFHKVNSFAAALLKVPYWIGGIEHDSSCLMVMVL